MVAPKLADYPDPEKAFQDLSAAMNRLSQRHELVCRKNGALKVEFLQLRTRLEHLAIRRAVSTAGTSVEEWAAELLTLVKEYGDECAVKAHHGVGCCKRPPDKVLDAIEAKLNFKEITQ